MGDHRVLIIGSGGREHAFAWKLAQSDQVGKIFIAPGNAGTRKVGQNIPIQPEDIGSLVSFARKNRIDLTVVGPEAPLALGIVDRFAEQGLPIFGPTSFAARIESSKCFAKEVMVKNSVSTAKYLGFRSYAEALDHAMKRPLPFVVKADGLAAGKGTFVCKTRIHAKQCLRQLTVERHFGISGNCVIVEDFIPGEEVSIHVLYDGRDLIMLPASRDYKPLLDDNKGENTGGMGAFSPIPTLSENPLMFHVKHKVVLPIIRHLSRLNMGFTGCLYPGIILNSRGVSVFEYNARFGDPEAQVYMRRLDSDIFKILRACVEKKIATVPIIWSPAYAVVRCALLS